MNISLLLRETLETFREENTNSFLSFQYCMLLLYILNSTLEPLALSHTVFLFRLATTSTTSPLHLLSLDRIYFSKLNYDCHIFLFPTLSFNILTHDDEENERDSDFDVRFQISILLLSNPQNFQFTIQNIYRSFTKSI